MCLKKHILASKLSQRQIDTIVGCARLFIKKVGQPDPIQTLFFDAYFPNTSSDSRVETRHLNGIESLYVSVLIHLSVVSFGYGLAVSRRIAAEAQSIGMSVEDLKSIESSVFDDLITRYVGKSRPNEQMAVSFSDAVNTLWESDQEMITTFKNHR